MSKNNKNIPDTIPVKPKATPGKCYAKVFTVDLKKSQEPKTEVKIKNPNKIKIKKSSSQIMTEDITVSYNAPYIDPEFVREQFESNSTHLACIRFKANCVVGTGIDILPDDSALKDYSTDPEYTKIEKFLNNPVNEFDEYPVDVFRSMMTDRFAFGNGYIECVKNKDEKKPELAELYLLPAYETRVFYDNTAALKKFGEKISIIQLVKSLTGKRFSVFSEESFKNEASSILWHKNINPFNRFYGYPDWYSATAKLILDRSIDLYNIKAFQNELLISFAIIIEGGTLDTEQEKAVQTFLRANYKGLNNAQKVLMLSSESPDVNIKIERITKEGREGSYRQTQMDNRDAVCIVHGVPAPLLGIQVPGRLGNTSSYDLFKVFDETIIKPEKFLFAKRINNMLKIGLGITKFHIEFKELEFEDLTQMINFATQGKTSGLLDDNEGRAFLGYEPRDAQSTDINTQINNIGKEINRIRKSLEE